MSRTFTVSKLIVVVSYLDFLLDFVNFNISTMLNPKEDAEEWRGRLR